MKKKAESKWLDLPTETGDWWCTFGRWNQSDGWGAWSVPSIVHVTEIVAGGLVLTGERVLCDKRLALDKASRPCVWLFRFQPVEYPASPWAPGDPNYRSREIVFYPNAPGWGLK